MRLFVAFLLTFALATSAQTLADNAKKESNRNHKADGITTEEVTVGVLNSIEKHLFGQEIPNYKEKSKSLPPGLQKHIAKYGTLPPGLAKRDVPPHLLKSFPKQKKGQKYVMVNNDIFLIETATDAVIDILTASAKK